MTAEEVKKKMGPKCPDTLAKAAQAASQNTFQETRTQT